MKEKHVLYEGIRLRYIACIVTLGGEAFSVMMIVLGAVVGPWLSMLGAALSILAMLAGIVLELVAVIGLRSEHPHYQTAMIALAVNTALGFVPIGSGLVISLARSVLSFAAVYFFIRATNTILRQMGQDAVAAAGDYLCKLIAVLMGVGVALEIIAARSAVTAIDDIVLPVLSVFHMVFLARYLRRSCGALKKLPDPHES